MAGRCCVADIPVTFLALRSNLWHNPHMFRDIRSPGALLLSALVMVQLAAASDLPQLSFNQMTDSSELVVSGTVTRTWADWDPDHKYIWTHYELAVSATHKGTAGQTVDIAEPGGQVNGMGMSISGAAGYAVGENVLAFLSRMPNGFLRTAGLGQGKYLLDTSGKVHGQTIFKSDSTETIRSLDGLSVSRVRQLVGARVRATGGRAQ
jgi:hypothetical protein